MPEFRMPSLGADMDAGKLLEWYVKPGDAVHRGDIVALVDTDKAAIEVEVFEDGVVDELLIEPGQEVPVGTTLARIRGGEMGAGTPATAAQVPSAEPALEPAPEAPRATPAARAKARELDVALSEVRGTGKHGVIVPHDVVAASKPRAREEPEAPPARPAATEPRVPAPSGGRPRISPRARRLAEELGVDVASLTGTGPSGTVTGDDVRHAASEAAGAPASAPGAAPAPATAPDGRRAKPSDERYAAMRRAIAAAMARSKRDIPHYYLGHHLDVTTALRWLEATNLERSIAERILPSALLLRAAVLAIREVPEMNGFYRDGAFEPSEAVHLGVGISLRKGGLIAPAILNAQDQELPTLMSSIKDLVARTRTLQLRSSEMSEATITVTALGAQGVETVYGVIYPPQVALVGFGTVQERPWAQGGLLGVRRVAHASLSADHRASDGHTGARYLAAIERILQQPEEL